MLCLISFVFAGESNLSVPLDSDAYRIISIGEVRGIIPNQVDVKPYTYRKVKSLLDTIYSSPLTTTGEKRTIENLLASFEKTYDITKEGSILEKGYLALTDGVAAGAKIKSTQTFGVMDKAFDSRNKITLYVKGEFFDAFSLYMDFGLLRDKLDHRAFLITDFRHECDGFYMRLDDVSVSESPFTKSALGYLMTPEISSSLFNDKLTIRFASIYRDWGPGLNNIALSGSARNFDAFEMTLEPASWISISAMVGTLGKSFLKLSGEAPLICDSETHEDVYDNNISIQRIEIEPFEGFRASIFESVIWRKRFELAYLNPIGVYMFAQNYIGDFDNMMAGFDASYTWKGVGKFYASLGIDEMNAGKLFWLRNIFSYQAGAVFQIPYGDFSSLQLQATYVGPFFGTHYTYTADKNPYGSTAMATSYVNKGYPLSYPLYPDSVELLAAFSTTITDWDLSLDFLVKDQMRSAQYSTGSNGTTLETLLNYKEFSEHQSEFSKRKFFSYIWCNTLDIEAKAKKSFASLPFDLNVGVQCIIESKRSYTFDDRVKGYPKYDIVNETIITNYGNSTTMNNDWSTSAKVNLSIGFSVYY